MYKVSLFKHKFKSLNPAQNIFHGEHILSSDAIFGSTKCPCGIEQKVQKCLRLIKTFKMLKFIFMFPPGLSKSVIK